MTITTSVSVASHVMTEILNELALEPLRHRFALLPFLNRWSIDGDASGTRKIPKRTEINEAVDDVEGADFDQHDEFAYGTPVTLVPTGKVAGIAPTVKSLRRRMPGHTRDQVIQALRSGSLDALPMLKEIATEIIQAHYRTAERAAMAGLANASESFGTTNTTLSFATVVDGQIAILDNRPEHRAIILMIDEVGVGHLRKEVLSNAALAQLWGRGYGDDFLAALGSDGKEFNTQPNGNVLGSPVIAGDNSLMTTANAGVDRVGAMMCIGKGGTAKPGSMRGHSEFCEGHSLGLSLVLDESADVAEAIGRYEWIVGEHTDEHYAKAIYRKT